MRTVKDNMNFLFSCKTQYNKKNTFIRIRNDTPKLTTAKIEKVLGGKKGNI